jgi:Tfp pilus assembly protein PilO
VNRRAPVIAVVAFVLLAILMVVFLVMPKMNDVGEAEDQLEAAQVEELTLQTELSRLQASAEDAPRLRAELAKARRAVPPVADLPGLINELQTAADVAGVDFFSISPGAPQAAVGASASEIPASIQVIGGFFPVDEFLFRLETLPRSSKVITLTLSEGPDGAPQIDVQLDVRFFTTDLEAGPGASIPIPPAPAPAADSPTPETTPRASPGPRESPTTIPSPTTGA